MCEGAELPILTLNTLVDIGLAELSFVLVRMVKLLHSIVSFLTLITIVALFVFGN